MIYFSVLRTIFNANLGFLFVMIIGLLPLVIADNVPQINPYECETGAITIGTSSSSHFKASL